jgi:hypothetical protein
MCVNVCVLDIKRQHKRFLMGLTQEPPNFDKYPFKFFVHVIFVMLTGTDCNYILTLLVF